MLYHLALQLQNCYSFLNIFRYISVRTMGALLTSIVIAFIFGNKFITFCQRLFRTNVREWTPESHQKKNDTPTMGGLFMLAICGVTSALWCNWFDHRVWILCLCLLCFGALGFFDDWYKITRKKGVSASFKFRLQIAIATAIASLWYYFVSPATTICIPFLKNVNPDLGLFITPWAAAIMVATSNAVNLTDGLDGLATGPLICNFTTFSVIAYLAGHSKLATYLFIPNAGTAELAVIGASLIGALLGFLWYNAHPAQIFMGDVGSLPLGAGLALMAIMAHQELLLIISGGIFVMETVSVILQVISFKFLGKRIFRMAPIHHHFELLGWQETKIVIRFWIISIILALCTLLTLKIR
jgi:phospho-N-acetylmuramoyl-pentapeptide-transferase